MGTVFMIVYWALGYWAVGQTIWANKILIGDGFKIVAYRAALGLVFGLVLIPWAIIKMIF